MKKIRGRKRLARRLDAFAEECRSGFPVEQLLADGSGRGYWHAHVPLPNVALVGPHARRALRRKVVSTLLSIGEHLVRIKPAEPDCARVVVVLDLPDLAASQIIVFFSDAYFDAFWSRTSPDQTWIPLSPARSLVREWGITIPAPFLERGFREVLSDDGVTTTSEIWAIGELADVRSV